MIFLYTRFMLSIDKPINRFLTTIMINCNTHTHTANTHHYFILYHTITETHTHIQMLVCVLCMLVEFNCFLHAREKQSLLFSNARPFTLINNKFLLLCTSARLSSNIYICFIICYRIAPDAMR